MTWPLALAARFARALLVVAVVVAVAWLLCEAAPGSPGQKVAHAAGVVPADDGRLSREQRQELYQRLAEQHGQEGSLAERMGRRLAGLARGDLGRSWRDGAEVGTEVTAALGPTLWVGGLALAVAALLGLAMGLLAARFAGSAIDALLGGAAALALAVPLAWLALVLYGVSGRPSVWLAVVSLAALPAAVVARHARAALVDAAAQPWAVATRARGVSRGRLVAVHALAATASGLMPLLPVLVAYLLGASLVVERVFAIHGLGALLADAAAWGDAPIVVGVSALLAFIIALSSAVADAGARAFDPRRRAP